MKLKNKVALVTGAGRGIGREIALEFAREGAKVVVNDINGENAAKVAAEIIQQGGQAAALVGDCSQGGEAERLVRETVIQFGTLDILINNAGITRDNLVTRLEEKDWDLVLDVNLKAPFNLIKEAFKIMNEKNYGKVVNIASISGQMGNIGQANYCASKSGVIGLTKCVAREGARKNITVNAVAPGFIDTEMTQVVPDKVKEKLLQSIPLAKIGKPRDIARACIFLSCDDSDYITGQVLSVNGGWYM